MEEEESLVLSEVKIEIDVAEEPEEELVHRVLSSGCQGSTATREQHTLSHQSHSDALCDIKAEPATHETAQHLMTGESVMAEPAAPDAPQHGTCENMKAEPTAHQTAQHAACENIKAESTAHGAEDSEEWGDFRGVTVKLEPVECSLQQENQASSPCPVQQEGKDVTDCCEPESSSEPASEKTPAKAVIFNSKLESRHRPSLVRVDIPHRCQLCPSAFVLYTNLETHMEAQHSQKMSTECSQPTPPDCGHGRLSAGNSEQKAGASRRPVHDACCEAYTRAGHLKTLKLIHSGDTYFVCNVCCKGFATSCMLKEHKQIHTGEKPFVCGVCGKGFTRSFHLKRHSRIHTGERPFVCDVCNKAFTAADHLKTHKLIHTGQKPFLCDVCSKGFIVFNRLKSHMLIHTDEKPFVCDVCSKAFTMAGNLNKHKLVHRGQSPFACDVCSKTFKLAYSLKVHKLIHTSKKLFVCDVCGQRFPQARHLKIHRMIHKGQKPFVCDVCSKEFIKASSLKRHKRMHTGLEVPVTAV